MKHIKFIVAIILMLIVVILIVQNHEAMSTRVVFRVNLIANYETSQLSVYHIVTIAFLFGIIVSGFYGIIERFRLKKQIKVLMSNTQEKDKELNSLRNLPITSDDVVAESDTNAL